MPKRFFVNRNNYNIKEKLLHNDSQKFAVLGGRGIFITAI